MRLLIAAFVAARLFAADVDLSPLLLNAKRLKRLKLDRDRQTDRWLALLQSVESNPKSPERGLELAIYAAVTADPAKAHEAIQWTVSHPCTELDRQLIDSATADLQTPQDAQSLKALACADTDHPLAAFGLTTGHLVPDEFLLVLRPGQVEHPDWRQHVAGLILVNLSPNSQGAQFLQGWTMEDRFTLHDSPGVAYEFLWADPYLPGVSYQNMDPWHYDHGVLFARSDWTPAACWIHVTATAREHINCSADLFSAPITLGNLTVLAAEKPCTDIPAAPIASRILVLNLPPGHKLRYTSGGDKHQYESDAAGLWLVPQGFSGKLCVAR